jgi:hypothetical protein
MKKFCIFIFLLFPILVVASKAGKFPVTEKILLTTSNRAIVEYTLLSDVTEFAINVYAVRQTVIWQKIIEGSAKTKQAGQKVTIEIEVDPSSTNERPLVGVEFSAMISGAKRVGVQSIEFTDPSLRSSESHKKIKVDKTGKKLRVVSIKEH